MMKHLQFLIFVVLGVTVTCYAQNASVRSANYGYQILTVDSSYDDRIAPALAQYIKGKKQILDAQMNVVVAHADEKLTSFAPQSPLSNFLTDVMLQFGPAYIPAAGDSCDLSMLNFFGIRAAMPKGEVTVGHIYAITPFDNYLVLVELKGSELRKALNRFTEKKSAAMAGTRSVYRNNHLLQSFVQGQPIDDNRIYRIITINFVSEGGDGLLSDIQFERTIYSQITFRDFLIEQLSLMTKNGKTISAALDDRVEIKPSF